MRTLIRLLLAFKLAKVLRINQFIKIKKPGLFPSNQVQIIINCFFYFQDCLELGLPAEI